jgi:competence protein ComEC
MATYFAVAAFAIWLRGSMALGGITQLAPSRPMRWHVAARRLLYVSPVALLLVSAGWLASASTHERRLELTVLDVGQGDAILIETPSGRDVLVDGGPGRAVLRGLGQEMAWHDRSIDLVVLTHPQADHATGLLDVFDRYEVRGVASASDSGDSLVARTLVSAWRSEGSLVRRVAAGTSIDLGDGARLDVLSPAAVDEFTGNDASLVLMLVYGDVRFLLTGDIEATAERALVAGDADLGATVLKVAHHGSATSSTRAFVDAVAPSIAVVSSSAGNRYGHPDDEVVARLGEYADVYNTAVVGAVHFETDGQRLWVDTDQ